MCQDTEQHRLEAYSWGGLTSGRSSRALWLLLLPFMLVNVAFYMTPVSPLRESPGWIKIRRVSESMQRGLALTLTGTFVLSMVTVAMDLVGWQCARTGTTCATGGWLTFFSWPWMQDAGRRLAVAALVPTGVVILLWWLGRKTWKAHESVEPPQGPPEGENRWRTPLEGRSFWSGKGPVARLRALHVSAALSVVGLFLTVPMLSTASGGPARLLSSVEWTRARGWLPASLATVFLLILTVCLGSMIMPSLSDRPLPAQASANRATWQPWLSGLSAALLAGAFGLAWFSRSLLGGPLLERPPTVLPWLGGATLVTVVAQFVLLLALALLCWLQARSRARHAAASIDLKVFPDASAKPVSTRPAFHGMASVVFAWTAWVIAGGFAAGMTLRVAQVLGSPVSAGSGVVLTPVSILIPAQYFWAAVAAVFIVLALVPTVVVALIERRRRRAHIADRVRQAYLSRMVPVKDLEQNRERSKAIEKAWMMAAVTEEARHALPLFGWSSAGILLASGIGFVLKKHSPPSDLVTIGSLIMTGAFLGLLYVGRQAYVSPRFRRTVGILWDLGTFWPRATHPLAPPCYAERTVPDLLHRAGYIQAHGGHVILSCHSQGTVIGAATVTAMSYDDSAKAGLLTYGCPLRRLYARFFPAYFGPAALLRVGELLSGNTVDRSPADHTAPPPGPAAAPATSEPLEVAALGSSPDQRRAWPWVNLYRRSDPIGGLLFMKYPPVQPPPTEAALTTGVYDGRDVDWQLVDPWPFGKPEGDSCYTPTLGHSDYWLDPAFAVAVSVVQQRRHAGTGPAIGERSAPGPVEVVLPKDAADY